MKTNPARLLTVLLALGPGQWVAVLTAGDTTQGQSTSGGQRR